MKREFNFQFVRHCLEGGRMQNGKYPGTKRYETLRNVGPSWKQMFPFFPSADWFGSDTKPETFNPQWKSKRVLPKGLQYNSFVTKQNRTPEKQHISHSLGDVSLADVNGVPFCTFKKATFGNMQIGINSASNISSRFNGQILLDSAFHCALKFKQSYSIGNWIGVYRITLKIALQVHLLNKSTHTIIFTPISKFMKRLVTP